MTLVTDGATRGKEINRRRHALGVASVSEFHQQTGVARDTIVKAEAGNASAGTYERLEAWLTAEEARAAARTGETPPPRPDEGMIEFEVTGPRTEWHVSVRGPIEEADLLRVQAEKLLRDMRPPTDS